MSFLMDNIVKLQSLILKAFVSQECIVKRLLFHNMVMGLYNIGVSLLFSVWIKRSKSQVTGNPVTT